MSDDRTPEERAAALRVKYGKPKAVEEPAPEPTIEYDSDLIPEKEKQSARSAEQEGMDVVIATIDPVDAYRRYIGKQVVESTTKLRDGIKVSCPFPHHRDSNPSAWINRDLRKWYCGGCAEGGDLYDLAAIGHGYDVSEIRRKGSKAFKEVRRQLAEDYGFTWIGKDTKGNDEFDAPPPGFVPEPMPRPESPISSPSPADNSERLATVTALPAPPTTEELLASDVRIDWESMFPEDTFMRRWMEACTIDDLPHEYYFFLGLMALGYAGGHDIVLSDFRDVKPNLYVCLYGATGVGKSRSIHPFKSLLEKTFPWTGDTDTTKAPTGVYQMPSPGSAEALIDLFDFTVKDPSLPGEDHRVPIKGLIKIEEFAAFVNKASGSNSTLKENVIELYDAHAESRIHTHTRGKGHAEAFGPFCQFISTTQPNAIHAFLNKTDTESGFLNRWIFAYGKPRVEPIAYGRETIDIANAVDAMLDIKTWVFRKKSIKYVLDGPALDEWIKFFKKYIRDHKMGVGEDDSMQSRIELTIKKIIVLLCINEKLDQPTAEIVQRATSLFSYLSMVYARIAGDIGFSDTADIQKRILEYIEKHEKTKGKPPTQREINNSIKNRGYDLDLVRRVMNNLQDLDYIRSVKLAGGRGPATLRFQIVSGE